MATQTKTQEAQVERIELGERHYPRPRHEIPKFVPKVEIRELVREVPEIEIEWKERLVEVADIEVREIIEEVEQTREVVKHVPKIEIVEVPVEQIEYVKEIEEKIVEKVVQVQSKTNIINVPQESIEYIPHVVPQFHDRQVAVVVNETIQPIIQETQEILEVPVHKYIPYLVPVDIYVPKPVGVPVTRDTAQDITEITPAPPLSPETIKNLLLEMNPHIVQMEEFNEQQLNAMRESYERNCAIAVQHGFEPPQPIDEAQLMRRIEESYNVTIPARPVGMAQQVSGMSGQTGPPHPLPNSHHHAHQQQVTVSALNMSKHKQDPNDTDSNDGFKQQIITNQPTIMDNHMQNVNSGGITPGKQEYHQPQQNYVLPAKKKV